MKVHRSIFEEIRVASSVKIGDYVDIYVKGSWQPATVQSLRKTSKDSIILTVKSSGTISQVMIDSRLIAK